MFKSIFSRQLIVCVGILFISVVMLSITLVQVFTSHFVDRQKEMLMEKGDRIADFYVQLGESPWMSDIVVARLENEIRILFEYLNISIFLVNMDYFVAATSPDIGHIHGTQLDETIMPKVDKIIAGEKVTIQGFVGDIFEEHQLAIGFPVVVQDETGAIFMSVSMPEIERSIADVVNMMSVYMIIFFLIAVLLIYVSSRSIINPIKEINNAAKVIADGNFEKRIIVNSKDEVGQLAESFNNMAQSLEKHENTRTEFIANISHDIRSPLTSIKGFLEAIMDGTIPKEKHEHYLKIVLDECIRLNKLANNLLYVSNIHYMGKERLELKAFDINILIKETIVKFDNTSINKEIEVSTILDTCNNMVMADYVKIQRVIYNLLDNAIKFSKKGGLIVIETTQKESKLYISIKDNGEGISLEEQGKIFERFYKVDSSRGKDKVGSGLGLSIVNEFIKAHNEKITVSSELGKGCEFVFTLDLCNVENKT